jgi:hypothetical protein
VAGANYEVNIQLKADPALKSLERIEEKIGQLGKTSAELADERAAAMVKIRDVGDQVRALEEKGVKVAKARLQVDQASAASDKGQLLTANQRVEIAQREVNTALSELKVEKQITVEQEKQNKLAKQAKQGQGKFGTTASSALIGGAFPLLFGQGGAAAAGGALGGLGGGLIGGQFGFAFSLIGTAIGQAIQEAEDFNRELASLNSSLSATGDVSITTGSDINNLATELGIAREEALKLVDSFRQFGEGDMREELARVFGPIGGTGTFEALAKARLGEKEILESIAALTDEIGIDKANELVTQLSSNGHLETAVALQQALLEASQKETKEKQKQVKFMDQIAAALAFAVGIDVGETFQESAEAIAAERAENVQPPNINIIERAIELRAQLIEKLKSATAATKELTKAQSGERIEQSLKKQLARYEEIDPMARKIAMIEADHLVNLERIAGVKDEGKRQQLEVLAEKLKEAKINDLLVSQDEKRAQEQERYIESFNKRLFSADAEGRILQATLDGRGEEQRLIEKINKETANLEPKEAALLEQRLRSNDALRQQGEQVAKLQQIYDSLGSTIANGVVGMLDAAFDRTKSLADAASNLLKNLANQLLQLGINTLLSSTGIGLFKNLPGFADGGTIMGGQAAIVGEKGPEVFVPGKTGTVIPNHALGGSNIVVNVDAGGSNVQGDGTQAKALGAAIGLAVQNEIIKQKKPGGLLY